MKPQEVIIIESISHILSGTSLICSLFVIITYLLFKRKTTARIILNLSFCSFFLSIAVIIPDQFSNEILKKLCIVQGTLFQFFVTFFLSMYLLLTFHLFVWSFTLDISVLHVYESIFWIICLIGSLISTSIPLFLNKIGRGNRNHCWIKHDDITWEIISLYIPSVIVFLFSLVMWTRILYTFINFIKKGKFSFLESGFHIGRHILFLSLFLIIFVIFGLEAVITYHYGEMFILTLFDTIALSTHGIIILLFYGLNLNNLKYWYKLIKCQYTHE
jgi:hypothetical protein